MWITFNYKTTIKTWKSVKSCCMVEKIRTLFESKLFKQLEPKSKNLSKYLLFTVPNFLHALMHLIKMIALFKQTFRDVLFPLTDFLRVCSFWPKCSINGAQWKFERKNYADNYSFSI